MSPAQANLLSRVSEACQYLPGVERLYLFGSTSSPTQMDTYSDLDLQAVSSQFEFSLACWPSILSWAGEIDLAFQLGNTLPATAFTLTFKDESPFHKVDIGLSDGCDKPVLINPVEPRILLWEQAPKAAPARLNPIDIYTPLPEGAAYFLVGEMLSAVRYVKARKRHRHLQAWRFFSSKVNAMLACYRWNGDPRAFPQKTMSTWDFACLDQVLDEGARLNLLKAANATTPEDMDKGLLTFTRLIADRIMPRLEEVDRPAENISQKYLSFIESELECEPDIPRLTLS